MPVLLDAAAVRAAVPMPDAVAAVRDAFLDLAAGNFVLPQRQVFGDVLVMPVHHPRSGSVAVKTLSVVRPRDPMVLGTLLWNGQGDQLLADARTVTTLRTGAASGVATELLAPPDASRLALLGTGAQAADQVRGVAAVRDVRELAVFGRSPERARALLDLLGAEFPAIRGRVATSASDAVADADVVCCATSASTPLFPVSALPERVHVNAIGSFRPSMRELPAELLASASCVVVDQTAAALEEAGEVIHAVETGLLARTDLVELGDALGSPAPATGRTVFKSVGVAVQDWAIGCLLERALG